MADEEVAVEGSSRSDPKLVAAERDVALAQARLSADLDTVSRAGKRLTTTLVRSARPIWVGVAVLTGVGIVATVWRSRRAQRPSRSNHVAPASSLWWELGRAAVVALASSAGRHLAEKLAAPLDDISEARQLAAPEHLRPPADS